MRDTERETEAHRIFLGRGGGGLSSPMGKTREEVGGRAGVVPVAEGVVAAILVSPREGAPMEVRRSIRAIPGRGLEGDRYFLGTGHWTAPGTWDEVTLVAIEDLERAGRVLGSEVTPVEARRNLVLRGIDVTALEGRRFRVGEVVLEGIRPCDPCRYLERLAGRPGLKSALAGRAGLRARIVEGGRIDLGAPVEA